MKARVDNINISGAALGLLHVQWWKHVIYRRYTSLLSACLNWQCSKTIYFTQCCPYPWKCSVEAQFTVTQWQIQKHGSEWGLKQSKHPLQWNYSMAHCRVSFALYAIPCVTVLGVFQRAVSRGDVSVLNCASPKPGSFSWQYTGRAELYVSLCTPALVFLMGQCREIFCVSYPVPLLHRSFVFGQCMRTFFVHLTLATSSPEFLVKQCGGRVLEISAWAVSELTLVDGRVQREFYRVNVWWAQSCGLSGQNLDMGPWLILWIEPARY